MISLFNYFHTSKFLYKRENRTAPACVQARLFRRVKWLGTREIIYDVSIVQSVARFFRNRYAGLNRANKKEISTNRRICFDREVVSVIAIFYPSV